MCGNIFSGGGNYETGFTDWVLAWTPEVEVWQVVGNMLAARYIRCICWHLPQSVSQLVCRFSHQLLLNISVQHLTSLSMQCNGCCRGCVEEFDWSNILGFFFFKLVYPKYQGWVDWVQYIRDPKYQGGVKLNPRNLDPTPEMEKRNKIAQTQVLDLKIAQKTRNLRHIIIHAKTA